MSTSVVPERVSTEKPGRAGPAQGVAAVPRGVRAVAGRHRAERFAGVRAGARLRQRRAWNVAVLRAVAGQPAVRRLGLLGLRHAARQRGIDVHDGAAGLGPIVGVLVAWAIVVAYAVIAMVVIAGSGQFFGQFLVLLGWDGATSVAFQVVLALLIGGTAVTLALRDVKVSMRAALTLEVISIVAITAVLVATVLKHGIVDKAAVRVQRGDAARRRARHGARAHRLRRVRERSLARAGVRQPAARGPAGHPHQRPDLRHLLHHRLVRVHPRLRQDGHGHHGQRRAAQ